MGTEMPSLFSVLSSCSMLVLAVSTVSAAENGTASSGDDDEFRDFFNTAELIAPVAVIAGLALALLVFLVVVCRKHARNKPKVLLERESAQAYSQFHPYRAQSVDDESVQRDLSNDDSALLCPGQALRAKASDADGDEPPIIPEGQNVVYRSNNAQATVEVSNVALDELARKPRGPDKYHHLYFPGVDVKREDSSRRTLAFVEPVVGPDGRDGTVQQNPLFNMAIPPEQPQYQEEGEKEEEEEGEEDEEEEEEEVEENQEEQAVSEVGATDAIPRDQHLYDNVVGVRTEAANLSLADHDRQAGSSHVAAPSDAEPSRVNPYEDVTDVGYSAGVADGGYATVAADLRGSVPDRRRPSVRNAEEEGILNMLQLVVDSLT